MASGSGELRAQRAARSAGGQKLPEKEAARSQLAFVHISFLLKDVLESKEAALLEGPLGDEPGRAPHTWPTAVGARLREGTPRPRPGVPSMQTDSQDQPLSVSQGKDTRWM